jgi:putative ABC transport system substrate-binding protein
MRRREFILLVGSAGAAWPLGLKAQQPARAARIGFLATRSLDPDETRSGLSAFYQGLREYGYIDGQNISVEVRTAEVERFPALALELVRLNLDLIVATNSLAARAVKQVTTTIPIVVAVMGDPVGDGLVTSLSRPGGNVTGLTFLSPQLVPKRLALLKEALPKATRISVLWHSGAYGEPTMKSMKTEAERAAQSIKVELEFFTVHGPNELPTAFSAISAAHSDALFIFPSPMLFTERKRIVEFVTEQRLPMMAMGKELVQLGGLMSYGTDITDLNRRCTEYVDKILRGAKPADLPVQQPTKFELAVNLQAAKKLGVTIPATLLARADEVIE